MSEIEKKAAAGRVEKSSLPQPRYERRAPSPQTIADVFQNHWRSELPGGIVSGTSKMFDDRRPLWVSKKLPGGLANKTIVELGPYEGYQTYLLEKEGANNLTSIEGNTLNFLKCLCVKEMYNLKARFMLGDATEYIKEQQSPVDLLWMSGILYHLTDPVRSLVKISQFAEALYLWTHFYDMSVTSQNEGQAKHFLKDLDRTETFLGRTMTLHARTYMIGNCYAKSLPINWQGGAEDITYWLEKDDLLYILDTIGYKNIVISGISETKSLPTISLLAMKR